ncbi:MAG: hypothetical protein U0821_10765 [Chloroflexota bacterium]
MLRDLAGEGGEDRRARLEEALGAYAEALRFRTAERAPLQYATTQNNRGNVLRDLAGEGGEDRRARLEEALGAYAEALRFCTAEHRPREHANVSRSRQRVVDEARRDEIRAHGCRAPPRSVQVPAAGARASGTSHPRYVRAWPRSLYPAAPR